MEFTCIQYKVSPWSLGKEIRQGIVSWTPWCKCHLEKKSISWFIQEARAYEWTKFWPVFSTTSCHPPPPPRSSSSPEWRVADDEQIVLTITFCFFFRVLLNIITASGDNSKLWLIDFFPLPRYCSSSFPTQHERQWNKNILAANRPHHGNSIDQPSGPQKNPSLMSISLH